MLHDCDVIQLRHHAGDTAMIVCKGCAQELPKEFFAVDKKRSTGRRYKCRACSAAEFKRWQQTAGYAKRLAKARDQNDALKADNPKKRWAHMAFFNAKRRAAASGLPFTITKDWVEQHAPDACPALGLQLNYANSTSLKNSPAIDRIDNTRGYEPDNCWVVSMFANRIKSDATLAEIEAVAHALRTHLDKRGANAVQAANTILHAA
jgi:hypothetical protein